ncbi:MAG: M16 family metallopeptidase [Sphingobacteriales bacterium]
MNTSSVTAPSDTELMAALSAKEKADIKPYEEKVIAASLLSKEPKAGKIISKTTNDKLGTTEIKLSNGVTISLKKTDFKADQILLSSYRYGGNAGYSEADKYSAENAVAVVSSMGVGNFNPVDLRKALAGKVASANPYISATGEGFKGSSSNKDIETMLQLLYLYATETRIDSSLFKSYIQKTKSQFAMMGANPQFAFIDTLYKTLYNGNPLAATALPKAENYDKVDLKKAVTIYKERLSDFAGMHFDIVGSFSETEILPLLEKYIGGLPTSSKMYSYTDNKVRPFKGDKELIFKKGKEKQSLILVLAGGEIAYSPEVSFNMQALSEVLNIKIIEELREKIQGIYGGGTNGGVNRIPYGSFQFALQLPCGPDKVDTLIKAYKAELASIASKGVEPSYLDKVKKQWIEEHKTSMKTNEYWLGKLQQFRQGDNAPDRMFNFESYVNALTSNDIQSAAKLVQSATTKLTAVLLPE